MLKQLWALTLFSTAISFSPKISAQDTVTLSPGEDFKVSVVDSRVTRVRCEGAMPTCKVVPVDFEKKFQTWIQDTKFGEFGNYDQAIRQVARLRRDGLCR